MQSMQCNAILQFNDINTINAMQCIVDKMYAGVDVGARGGAWHQAFYARELHDLHNYIYAIVLRNANFKPYNILKHDVTSRN